MICKYLEWGDCKTMSENNSGLILCIYQVAKSAGEELSQAYL